MSLLEREDNPRQVEAELRIQRGTIYDSNNVVLAENSGTPERQSRVYHEPAAQPLVGYYSLRYGTSGIEDGFDALLRGEPTPADQLFEQDLLHLPQVGQDIRLTLDLELQKATISAFEEKTGAAVLLSVPDGVARMMVSQPTFDPNLLDEQFDVLAADESAPLINRVTQGLYQPGLIIKPLLLAAAAEGGVTPPEAITADSSDLRQLQTIWSAQELESVFAQFGLLSAPQIALPVAAAGSAEIEDVWEALIGEESLTITPLQLAIAYASLANDGVLVNPTFVSAIRSQEDGEWRSVDTLESEPNDPAEVRSLLRPNIAIELLEGLPVQGPVAEYYVTVQSGPDSVNSWYVGFSPPNEPRYVLILVLENESDVVDLQQIGQEILELARSR